MEFNEKELFLIRNSLLFVSRRLENYIDLEEGSIVSIIDALRVQADLLSILNKIENK